MPVNILLYAGIWVLTQINRSGLTGMLQYWELSVLRNDLLNFELEISAKPLPYFYYNAVSLYTAF